MKNLERIASIATLLLYWCAFRPVSTDAQDAVTPQIVVGVSINESEAPNVYQGWPFLASVIIMNENAYQSNVLPVSLTLAWKTLLHFVVRNSQGEIVSWPFHPVPVSDENMVLDGKHYAQLGFWLEPNETDQIPPGQYELTAILDSSAYPGLGSQVLSARSGYLRISILNEPGTLTLGQKTEKDFLLANLNILKGDDQEALEYLSGILGYNPTDLRTLSLIGYLLENEGDYGGALYAYSKGLEIFYQENPDPVEPPIELLLVQKKLFYKLDTSTSFVITLAAKDTAHPAYHMGSPFAYYADNIPARELLLERGKTYTFPLKDVPSTDPMYFSTNSKGGGMEPYTAGVSGTPAEGNGTATIAVSDSTPDVLYYQSSMNEFVGWRMIIVESGSVTSVPEIHATHLSGYSLSLAYPNPVNSTTRIQYSLPRAANVRLTVLDIRGKQVAILVDEHKEAGPYQVEWNPQLPDGVYFYQIQAGAFKETRKMLLVR